MPKLNSLGIPVAQKPIWQYKRVTVLPHQYKRVTFSLSPGKIPRASALEYNLYPPMKNSPSNGFLEITLTDLQLPKSHLWLIFSPSINLSKFAPYNFKLTLFKERQTKLLLRFLGFVWLWASQKHLLIFCSWLRPVYTAGDREKGNQLCPVQWKEYWQEG